MLNDYISQQLLQAKYRLLNDYSYFGEVPKLKGVWSNGTTLKKCQKDLEEVLGEWIMLKIKDGDKIPGFS